MEPTPEQLDTATEPTVDPKAKKRYSDIHQQITVCKEYRKKLVRNWSVNIDYRRGKPFSSQSDDDQIAVNMDWSLTKTKHAALFSQVPRVTVAHHPESVMAGPWLSNYERRLNDNIRKAGIEAAMAEIMPDCINAAGIGVALVAAEMLTEDKEIPAVDISTLPPQVQTEAMQSNTMFGQPIPMEVVPVPVSRRYTVRRISPADFLWPIDFTGSDFDNAPWLGHTGRITWAEAVNRFNLKEEDKQEVLSDETTVEDRLSHDWDREKIANDGKVGFDEIFYHEFQYDPEAKSFDTIHHLVFLHGRAEPVIDEPWKGQVLDGDKVVGCLKTPLRVLTLTYLSDENVPPSDTAIGRAQVNELNKGRTQINKQRERSIPARWIDINRADPTILQALFRGTWQPVIPVQGDGTRIIGEIATNKMSQENFLFDKIAKGDLNEQWTIGPNQIGVGEGVETKGESNVIQSNFMTKVGMERARVASFIVGVAQCLGGLMCLYEDPASLGEGFDPSISEKLDFSVLADSTVLVDSNQRLERLNKFLDTYAKTGWVNLEPILKEIASLIGLDPTTVITPPQPKKPAEPNISLRLTGEKDMMNPLMLAFLLKSGQAPDPKLIEQAKQLIQQAVVEQQPTPEPGLQGAPPPGSPLPQPAPPAVGDANPDATILPTIGKRSDPSMDQ